jgi:hypothetical protein
MLLKFIAWMKKRRRAWLEKELADVEEKISRLSSETVKNQEILREVGSPESFNRSFMLQDRQILNGLKERRDWIKGELASL